MSKWKTISLPREMMKEIEKFIKEHPEYGYSSVSDFVRTAIKAYIDYRKILEQKEQAEQPSKYTQEQ